jgi:ABC-2 type transport system ATP-binding protein
MTQKFSFWNELTVRENLEFVARIYELDNRRRCVDDTLDLLSLGHRQHQLAEALSGGWKQLLALAAVTIHKPELLLLDETNAGVDPQARRDFWDQIHRLSNEGMTVLVCTHYIDEAERCDHIVYRAFGNLIT